MGNQRQSCDAGTHTGTGMNNEHSGHTHRGIHEPDGSDGVCVHGVCPKFDAEW